MATFTDASRRRFGPIGRCIYCGATGDLTREHIIPRSLGGTWVLGKASCTDCASITRDFEQRVAREMFGGMRSQLGFPSSTYKRDGGLRTIQIIVSDGSDERAENLPADSAPPVPVFLPNYKTAPGTLLLRQPTPSFGDTIEVTLWSSGEDPRNNETIKRFIESGATAAHYRLKFPQTEFCRLLAKIAHASVFAIHGDAIPSILPAFILGTNPCLPQVVGGTTMACRNLPDELHWGIETGVFDRGDQKFVTVKIELFRFLFLPKIKAGAGPVYWIVVCPADDRLVELVGTPAKRW
jgi:hypothetical protein